MAKKIAVATKGDPTTTSGSALLKAPTLNPEIRRFADEAARGLHYSFLAAAMQQDTPFAAGSVEEEFRRGIHSCRPEVRDAIRAKALALANAPASARLAAFGRFGHLSAAEHASRGFLKAIVQLPPLPVNGSALAPLVELMKAQVAANEAAKKKEKIKLHFAPVSGISFYITRVTCRDETDGAFGLETGDDEILVGGLGVDHIGNVTKAKTFLAGSEFDDGEAKTFAGLGHRFHRFDVAKGGGYPRRYGVVIMLAEADWGGFADAVNTAYQSAAPSIKTAYEKAIGVVLSTMTPLPGPVADKIAEIYVDVAEYIVANVINFLLMFVGDDVFPASFTSMGLHTPVALSYATAGNWKDGASPTSIFYFRGHGGEYRVDGYWRVDSAS